MDGPVHDGLVLIKQERSLLFSHLLISGLFSYLGIFLFLDLFFSWGRICAVSDSKSENFLRMSVPLLLILISVPDCWVLICDIFSPKVVFAYDNNGFYLKNGEFFIPWSDVSDVVLKNKKRLSKYKEKVIALKFNSEHIFVGSLPIFCKFMYFIRKMIYGYGILICLEDTDGSLTAADIFQIFVKKCPQAVYIK